MIENDKEHSGDIMMKFNYANAIIKLRVKLNISQTELAKMLGVSFSSVNRWEKGKFMPTVLAKERLIKSFSDGCIAFASGAVLGAIGYEISNGISKGLARRKFNKIVPNWNAKNGKINKQLANAGYKNLKIGRDGYNKIFDTIYNDCGYKLLEDGITHVYDFITSLF